MKKQFAVAVALLGAAIATVPCYAQWMSSRADIPFAFQVGNKTMPAGRYLIERVCDSTPNLQMIRRTDSSAVVTALTIGVDANGRKSEPELVFHKYGNSYFLAEIWTGGAQGRQLLKSERERELAKESAGREVAVSLEPALDRGL